jgi:phytoene dehydrogenase-like protein
VARFTLNQDFNVALLLNDGESLEWWTNFEKTAESFARFSKRDEQALRKWQELFLPIVEKILIPESQSPPVPPEQRNALLEKSPEGRLLLATSALSPLNLYYRNLSILSYKRDCFSSMD